MGPTGPIGRQAQLLHVLRQEHLLLPRQCLLVLEQPQAEVVIPSIALLCRRQEANHQAAWATFLDSLLSQHSELAVDQQDRGIDWECDAQLDALLDREVELG
eukprot:13410777-Heterocapsa_arctica.AAC.1